MVDIWCQTQPLQCDFKTRNVPGAHVHYRVGASGNGARIHHLRHRTQNAAQFLRCDSTSAEQFDVRFGRQAVNVRVDLDRKSADHLVCNEPVDAPFYRRRGKTHNVADVAVACARVLAEKVDDAEVETVHRPSLR